jgi:hypothetical protein
MLLVPLTRRLCSGSILLELTSRAKLCVKAPGFFAYPGGKESAKNSFAMVSSILGPLSRSFSPVNKIENKNLCLRNATEVSDNVLAEFGRPRALGQ